jgi:hypothetical protein
MPRAILLVTKRLKTPHEPGLDLDTPPGWRVRRAGPRASST